ncbi:701_t:CDS:2 [Entrophospora sp. SA101]|nr:13061_t:CDS:2 [Entrophospora sp. SA101]CAJ0757186.1 701_t:CDS:2 [Entrophospora sp. SA101]
MHLLLEGNLTEPLNEVEEFHITGDEKVEKDISEEQIIALDFEKMLLI